MRLKTIRPIVATFASFILTSVLAMPLASAQRNGDGTNNSLRGYSPENAKTQIDWESKFRRIPNPENMRAYMNRLAAEPHHLGSAYDKQNAEYIRDKFKSWGLEASLEEFDVLFPTPTERVLEMIEPTRLKLELKEPVVPDDPDSADENQLPTYNAYSCDGDVTGQLVYVNYGVPADYEELAKRGVDVKGKIVIARYGGSWRGIKPKVAAEHGAIGCIIYSDPRDDGYYQGDVFPRGPYRPEQGVQRGSVMDSPIHPGDPLTPGWGAVKGARRIPREEADVITKIPVLPISYGDAAPLLRAMTGPIAPESWRGALPLTYHLGPGPTRVHLKVSFDWSLKTLYNVIGRITGSTYPDEWIVYGNHHDAWVNGADDPISGMVTVMEAARSWGELLTQGWKPKRTIVVCAWDGEEQGLLGSTEWAETHRDQLKKNAVLYLNSDSNGKGQMGAGGSHSLERFVNEVAGDISQPGAKRTVLDAARERRVRQARTDDDKKLIEGRKDLAISALGSGSDYTPFLQHLGIASLNISFGGDDGGGVYHSIYDSIYWYTKFSDGATFEHGRALAQLNGTIVMRAAGADVLPFDFVNLAETVGRYVDELDKLAKRSASADEAAAGLDMAPLAAAVRTLTESAKRYDASHSRAAARGFSQVKDFKQLNALLVQSERKLTSDQGLPQRPWFTHLLYAPGFYTGYGVKTIPGVREALEQRHWKNLPGQTKNVATALQQLASLIDSAARLIEGK
jgi:N-acetylated-alpha-linked acidic dipeptidase